MTYNDNVEERYLELTATDTIEEKRMSTEHTAMNVKLVVVTFHNYVTKLSSFSQA